ANDPDFFWLGRVPCRTVLFYGMVIGVQDYEQRTVYTVDDGSGAIGCNWRYSKQQPATQRMSPVKNGTSKRHQTSQKYASTSTLIVGTGLPVRPKPMAHVGDIVRVAGHVLNRHQTRLVNLDKIEVCKSANVEPLHWINVIELHQSWYHATDAGPFVIPALKVTAALSDTTRDGRSQSQLQNVRDSQSQSPSRSSIASSAPSSPSSVTSNVSSSVAQHYMDNAAPNSLSDESQSDDDDAEPRTPTKRRKKAVMLISDETPRASSKQPRTEAGVDSNETPRRPSSSYTTNAQRSSNGKCASDEGDPFMKGYTLSHLRRVPELATLARRVVDAESKRRVREERKKQKEEEAAKGSTSTSSSMHRSSRTDKSRNSKESEPRNAKMKRLFRFAIRQLYEEGSIVLWDGPVRALPSPPPARLFTASSVSMPSSLWKSSASTAGDSTGLSLMSTNTSLITMQETEEDQSYWSDPPANEESYIPLTPAYLCHVVEGAIASIVARRSQASRQGHSSIAGLNGVDLAKRISGNRPAGPTAGEIVDYLKKRDERWMRVGEWAVKEALEWGMERGRVWCLSGGRWEVCGLPP
ncbi:hypothetical protein PHLCEN_2v13538, partial [Hermanssonia centrifuga]